MKNKFKRVLSSILAFIMVFSCVAVMNVSNVLAATELSTTAPDGYDSDYTTISTFTASSRSITTYTYNFERYAGWYYDEDLSNTFTVDDTYFYGLTGELQIADENSVKFSSKTKQLSFTVANGYTANISIEGTTAEEDDGTNYVNLYENSTSSTALTADRVRTDTVEYTGLESGQTYIMTRANTNLRIEKIEIEVEAATFYEGILYYSYDENCGSVTFKDSAGNEIESMKTVSGGTTVTLTAEPNEGYYATATVNEKSVYLANNTYSWSFNGNTSVVVTFSKTERLNITESISYDYSDTDTEAYISSYGAGTYYFGLTDGAAFNSGSYIALDGTGSNENNSIVFSTGELTGKTAFINVEFVTDSDEGTLVINDGSDSTDLGSSSDSSTYVTSFSYTLASNTDYWLGSSSSGICIRKIIITVTDSDTEEETDSEGVIYVGYVEKDGYEVYDAISDAVDKAGKGDIIQLAPKTFTEQVRVDVDNITIKGADAGISIITYNDSREGFNNATVTVCAEDFTAENLTIKNTSEYYEDSDDDVYYVSAVSVGYEDDASATLNNCVIFAAGGTIYTGEVDSDSSATYNNCTIYGFQDVICGSGNVTLNNCTWDVNSENNARLFAPQNGAVCIANNLTVINSEGECEKSAFARAWGQSSDKSFDCEVIINGYTDDDDNIIPNGTAIGNDSSNPSVYGFETEFADYSRGDITEMMWLVRENQNDNFNTTYAALNTTSANALVNESVSYESDNSAYRIVGKINSDFVDNENIKEIGFAVYYNGELVGNMSSDTVYTQDDEDYYTVNFAENVNVGSVTVRPYVLYNDYNVEGGEEAEQTLTFNAE